MRRCGFQKKEWKKTENKIAALESLCQGQQEALLKHIKDHEQENKELKKILMQVKEEIYKGVAQIS